MTFDEIQRRMVDNGARIMEETNRAVRIEWRNSVMFIPKPATGDHYTQAELDQIRNVILQNTEGELILTFNGDVSAD
ncbi:hypothetical protein [Candidatus Puniceispirillum sp.]|uniref:hypothetical protein n=1 Tax=Candidatus Puniceispirillum sp. TaxID=2026719 RepID=UPI003F69AD11